VDCPIAVKQIAEQLASSMTTTGWTQTTIPKRNKECQRESPEVGEFLDFFLHVSSSENSSMQQINRMQRILSQPPTLPKKNIWDWNRELVEKETSNTALLQSIQGFKRDSLEPVIMTTGLRFRAEIHRDRRRRRELEQIASTHTRKVHC
jgi:hypothetical protein